MAGFDLRALNDIRRPDHHRTIRGTPLWAHPHRRLSAPRPLLSWDFRAAAGGWVLGTMCTQHHIVHGVVRLLKICTTCVSSASEMAETSEVCFDVFTAGTGHAVALWLEYVQGSAGDKATGHGSSEGAVIDSSAPDVHRAWNMQGLRLIADCEVNLQEGDQVWVEASCMDNATVRVDVLSK